MKIAVTAASGRLGRATLNALIDSLGHDSVVAICRAPEKLAISGIEVRRADYASVDDHVAAFAEIDRAVMISAPVVAGVDRAALELNVIEAAKQAAIDKMVYTSVIGNGDELDTGFAPNQRITRATEVALASSGLEAIMARNGLYVDLDLLHIIRAADKGTYRNNGGSGRCGYVSIAELGVALAGLVISDEHREGIFNLHSESVTQAQLVDYANAVFGLRTNYEPETLEESVTRLMQDPRIATRGEIVARMLAGVFEAIERGAFDVPSDFERAAGRPPLSIPAQMEALRPTVAELL